MYSESICLSEANEGKRFPPLQAYTYYVRISLFLKKKWRSMLMLMWI